MFTNLKPGDHLEESIESSTSSFSMSLALATLAFDACYLFFYSNWLYSDEFVLAFKAF